MDETTTEKMELSAVVHGRVQGVGFRYAAANEARRQGLRGWVQNLPDGSVQVVCEGPRAAVERYRDWLRTGPRPARVDRVDAHEAPYRGRFASFTIEY
ncbi:MAG: acylphosphatase [Spirochaetaceae bacterium]|nr:MAG: acylphosphatase [Spirochaetaceae bacterium]